LSRTIARLFGGPLAHLSAVPLGRAKLQRLVPLPLGPSPQSLLTISADFSIFPKRSHS
jgi:hypothetical protein